MNWNTIKKGLLWWPGLKYFSYDHRKRKKILKGRKINVCPFYLLLPGAHLTQYIFLGTYFYFSCWLFLSDISLSVLLTSLSFRSFSYLISFTNFIYLYFLYGFTCFDISSYLTFDSIFVMNYTYFTIFTYLSLLYLSYQFCLFNLFCLSYYFCLSYIFTYLTNFTCLSSL